MSTKPIATAPHAWLEAQRIAESRRLLAMRELPVTEIALAAGYQTPSALTAAFREVKGITRRGLAENRASRRTLREIW